VVRAGVSWSGLATKATGLRKELPPERKARDLPGDPLLPLLRDRARPPGPQRQQRQRHTAAPRTETGNRSNGSLQSLQTRLLLGEVSGNPLLPLLPVCWRRRAWQQRRQRWGAATGATTLRRLFLGSSFLGRGLETRCYCCRGPLSGSSLCAGVPRLRRPPEPPRPGRPASTPSGQHAATGAGSRCRHRNGRRREPQMRWPAAAPGQTRSARVAAAFRPAARSE
jgi:hypothetical protein